MRQKSQVEPPSRISRLRGFIGRRRAARRERWRAFFDAIRSTRRGIAALLLLAYLGVLGYLTLFRFHQLVPDYNLIPGRSILHDLGNGGSELVINTLGNIAATVPFGFLLPLVVPRWARSALRVALAALLTSTLIELTQFVLGKRVADVDDVILNTLGGWFGYGLSLGYRWWFKTRIESCIQGAWSGGDHKTRGRVHP